MPDEKKLTTGVAVDQWKLRTYRRALKKAGFEIVKTTPDDGSGFALIQIKFNPDEKEKIREILEKLERKYSQRNKLN